MPVAAVHRSLKLQVGVGEASIELHPQDGTEEILIAVDTHKHVASWFLFDDDGHTLFKASKHTAAVSVVEFQEERAYQPISP